MSKIKLIFSIFGDSLRPQELTNKINIEPSNYWNKGDPISNRKKPITRQETCWEYAIDFEKIFEVEKVCINYLNIFSPKKGIISKYIKGQNLKSKIDIIIEVENSKKPSIYFTRDFIDLLHIFHCEVDIDLYIIGNNDN